MILDINLKDAVDYGIAEMRENQGRDTAITQIPPKIRRNTPQVSRHRNSRNSEKTWRSYHKYSKIESKVERKVGDVAIYPYQDDIRSVK